jgi:hypothetical protein
MTDADKPNSRKEVKKFNEELKIAISPLPTAPSILDKKTEETKLIAVFNIKVAEVDSILFLRPDIFL